MRLAQRLLFCCLPLMCGAVLIAGAPTPAAAQMEKPAAELIALLGVVQIKSPAETQFREARLKDKLYPQDAVRTLADSKAKLLCRDESILILGPDSHLEIPRFDVDDQGQRRQSLVKMLTGMLRFIVHKFPANASPGFEIQTMTAVVGIRGTDGVIEIRSPDTIYLLSGRRPLAVRNLSTNQTFTLTSMNYVISQPHQPFRSGPISPEKYQQLLHLFQLGAGTSPGFIPPNLAKPLLPPDQLARDPLGNPALVPDTQRWTFTGSMIAQSTLTTQTGSPPAPPVSPPPPPLPSYYQYIPVGY